MFIFRFILFFSILTLSLWNGQLSWWMFYYNIFLRYYTEIRNWSRVIARKNSAIRIYNDATPFFLLGLLILITSCFLLRTIELIFKDYRLIMRSNYRCEHWRKRWRMKLIFRPCRCSKDKFRSWLQFGLHECVCDE